MKTTGTKRTGKPFARMGAKVKKTGKTFSVVHGTNGMHLSTHRTEALAREAAKETRERNRFAFLDSRRLRAKEVAEARGMGKGKGGGGKGKGKSKGKGKGGGGKGRHGK